MLTFLAAEGGGVHRLAHDLDYKCSGLLYGKIVLVILFQQALGRAVVGANASRLPPRIVAGRI